MVNLKSFVVATSGIMFIQNLLKINELVQNLKLGQRNIRPVQKEKMCVCANEHKYYPIPPPHTHTNTCAHALSLSLYIYIYIYMCVCVCVCACVCVHKLKMTIQANFFYFSKEKQTKNARILFQILIANCRAIYVIQEYKIDFSQFLLPAVSIINNFRNICLNKFFEIIFLSLKL
jgi:hypothetical protein